MTPDPWKHVARAAELVLGAVAQNPSPRLLEVLRELQTAEYLAGVRPDRRAQPREEG